MKRIRRKWRQLCPFLFWSFDSLSHEYTNVADVATFTKGVQSCGGQILPYPQNPRYASSSSSTFANSIYIMTPLSTRRKMRGCSTFCGREIFFPQRKAGKEKFFNEKRSRNRRGEGPLQKFLQQRRACREQCPRNCYMKGSAIEGGRRRGE